MMVDNRHKSPFNDAIKAGKKLIEDKISWYKSPFNDDIKVHEGLIADEINWHKSQLLKLEDALKEVNRIEADICLTVRCEKWCHPRCAGKIRAWRAINKLYDEGLIDAAEFIQVPDEEIIG